MVILLLLPSVSEGLIESKLIAAKSIEVFKSKFRIFMSLISISSTKFTPIKLLECVVFWIKIL